MSRPVRVRTASLSDLKAVSRLARQSVERDYSFYPPAVQRELVQRNSLKSLLASRARGGRRVLVAEAEGEIIGAIIASPNNDGIALVYWIYVDAERRAKGAGRALLHHFEQHHIPPQVTKIMLWTEIAADYYTHLGWTRQAELPNHWWGQDWTIFTKELKRSN